MIVSPFYYFLLMIGVGDPKDRLNYSIECLSPNVINVSWEITQWTFKDNYIVTAQFTCRNSTSLDEVRSLPADAFACTCLQNGRALATVLHVRVLYVILRCRPHGYYQIIPPSSATTSWLIT